MANGLPMLCPVPYVDSSQAHCNAISFLQGSDFTSIYIRSTEQPLVDAENDSRLADELRFVKYSSIAWTHDNKGFFYQVRFLPFGLTRSMNSIRGSRIACKVAQRILKRLVRKSEVARTLSFSITTLALTNVRFLICLSAWLTSWSGVAEDILVMKNPDQPEWLWGAAISEVDGRWLELYISRDTSRVCFSVLVVALV